MCVECNDEERLSRRSFVKGATLAVAGAAFALPATAQQNAPNALDDPSIIVTDVEYKCGTATIKGFLARPRKRGRHRMVLIAHGNAGVPPDIKFTAAELAKAGFVALVYDWASREPQPADAQERDKWVVRITSYKFIKLQMQDLEAGISYLREQPFTMRERVGMVGFCAGGRLGYLFSTRSTDVTAMVSLYGPVVYHMNNPKADPVPDVLTVAGDIKVPVQGHYGMLDQVAMPDDAKLLEKEMRRLKKPVEMYYYETAGHSFCNFTRPQGTDPGYDYNPQAAALAHKRMIKFLRHHLD